MSVLSRSGPPARDDFPVAAGHEVDTGETIVPVRRWQLRFAALLACADVLSALLAALICWAVRGSSTGHAVTVLDAHLSYRLLAGLSLPVWIAAMAAFGAYQPRQVGEGQREYRLPVFVGLRLLAAVAIASFALHSNVSRSVVLVYFPALVLTELLLRFGALRVLAAARVKGKAVRRLLVVGDEQTVTGFVDHLSRHRTHGYRVVGAALPDVTGELVVRGMRIPVVSQPDELLAAALRLDAEAVAVIGHGRFEQATLQQVAWQLERSGVDLLVAPDVVDLAGPRIRVAPVMGLPLLYIGEPRIRRRSQVLKALYERLLAVPLLALAAPVMAVVAVLIRLDSAGPVLYSQERIGHNAKPFRMLKFRTMVPDADARLSEILDRNEFDGGVLFKMRDDPRITRVGRWLRRYSIDELPQLINVVRGDMLLIGPRPCLEREVGAFGAAAHRRFMARPGLTGLWQVSGRADLPYEDAVRLDLYYVENWSIAMDLSILWKTVLVLLGGRGGY